MVVLVYSIHDDIAEYVTYQCRAEIYFRSSGRTANSKIDLDFTFKFEFDDVYVITNLQLQMTLLGTEI